MVGLPGLASAAGRNGRRGRALKKKGTGTLTPGPLGRIPPPKDPHPWPLSHPHSLPHGRGEKGPKGQTRTNTDRHGRTGGGRGGLPPRGGGSELGESALEGDLSGVIEGQAAGGVEEPGERGG